ncbi:MAG: secondary thiamine-phosphate synthase enzyme YjbQ [Nitrospinota bacterium]|nr:secondary thiamine-phosphate synthase enzyme YjbQ [Nitrospinota bacterium]
MVNQQSITITTRGFCDIVDITGRVSQALSGKRVINGVATIFIPGSTAAVTTIEYESGAVADLRAAIERIAPQHGDYLHNERWGDGNGFSHVRAALLGPSLSVPLIEGSLALGMWQQIVLVDFDNKARSRKVIVSAVGE